MKKNWFMQWDVGAWLKDPLVSMLKPSTRGIWFDANCAMHELDQCGQLQGTVADLARLCRCTATEMTAALDDLAARNAADVTVCHGNVTLINRRMRRAFTDRKSSLQRKKRQRYRERHGVDPPDVTDASLELEVINTNPPNPPWQGGKDEATQNPPHGVSPEFWELAPENIRIDSMRELWSEWVEYRRERKPKVTSRSAKMQLAELAEMGIEQATAAIRASIANGWQGIFPPRGSGKRVEAEDEFKPRAPTEDELKFLFPKEA